MITGYYSQFYISPSSHHKTYNALYFMNTCCRFHSVDDAGPGAVIAVQTFGDYQNFNLHLHLITPNGCFYGNGGFAVGPEPRSSDLEEAFRLEVTNQQLTGKWNSDIICVHDNVRFFKEVLLCRL